MTIPTRRSLAAARRRAEMIRAAVVAGIVLAVAAAGSAAAYFTALGSGSGAASSATAVQSVTLTVGAASGDLYPGGTGTVTTTATNTAGAAVRLSSLALDTTQGSGGFAIDAAHSTCPTSALSFTTQTNGGAGWTVPASGSLTITLAGALAMTTTAPDACQGATITVSLRAGS